MDRKFCPTATTSSLHFIGKYKHYRNNANMQEVAVNYTQIIQDMFFDHNAKHRLQTNDMINQTINNDDMFVVNALK